MFRTAIAAATLAVFVLTSTAASAQVCIVGIFAAAIYVSAKEKRELTSKEAASCGLMVGHDEENAAKLKAKNKAAKKAARRSKATPQ